MFNNLAEVELKFTTLTELAIKLAGFESSGLKKSLESFQETLRKSKSVKQSSATITTLKRVLDSSIVQVESWTKSEAKEQTISDDGIKELKAKLSRTSQLLTVKQTILQLVKAEQKDISDDNVKTVSNEADQKYAEDPIEQKSQKTKIDTISGSAFLKQMLDFRHHGLLKMLMAHDQPLINKSKELLYLALGSSLFWLRSTALIEELAEIYDRINNLALSYRNPPGGDAKVVLEQLESRVDECLEQVKAMIAEDKSESRVEKEKFNALTENLKKITELLPPKSEESPTVKSRLDAQDSVVMRSGIVVIEKNLENSRAKVKRLESELAKALSNSQASPKATEEQSIAYEELNRAMVELGVAYDSLVTESADFFKSRALHQATVESLSQENEKLKVNVADLTAAKSRNEQDLKQLAEEKNKLIDENERLAGNLEEENRRYLVRDAEAKAAVEAKEIAEQSAAFAVMNLDTVVAQLNENTRATRVAESELETRSAQLKRNLEDLKHLNADILELAELAENLQVEKDKYYTESQYGYIREKCDVLQRRRGELMERVHAAEKSAKQATLEVGYQDSAQRGKIQTLEAEIEKLKENTFALEQECKTLKSSDIVTENEQLKAKLKVEREKKFSDVLGRFDNAAAAGALVLEKKTQEQKTEIDALKSQLAAQSESLPVIQIDESKLTKNIKRLTLGAGFILAGIATVAALGFLGAVAVTYALPLLAIGLVVAAGGTLIAKLLQSKHEAAQTLEVLERKEAEPVLVQRSALVVKSTMEKAVISVSTDFERA